MPTHIAEPFGGFDDPPRAEAFTPAMLAGYEADLGAIEAALGTIADGTFGLCHRCGSSIDSERLRARLARQCGNC